MNTTRPKPFIFVLMPFAPEFDDVYQLGIKPACEKAGAYAERLDQQIFTESILDRIYSQISKADVIVSDMTGRDANVFYETGYAHALGKKVILLTQKADDIPFDLKHYQHIIYAGRISDLIPELENRVGWALQQPKSEILQHKIKFYLDGQDLSHKTEIHLPLQAKRSMWDIKIDAHNPTDVQIKETRFKIGIIINAPSSMSMVWPEGALDDFKQPDGNVLSVLRRGVVLSPGSWTSFRFSVGHTTKPLELGDSLSITIRTFSQDGVADLQVSIDAIDSEEA